MQACEFCRAPVTIAQTEEGERIVLEAFSEPIGNDRWTIIDFSTEPWTARAIDGSSPVDAYKEHQIRCVQ